MSQQDLKHLWQSSTSSVIVSSFFEADEPKRGEQRSAGCLQGHDKNAQDSRTQDEARLQGQQGHLRDAAKAAEGCQPELHAAARSSSNIAEANILPESAIGQERGEEVELGSSEHLVSEPARPQAWQQERLDLLLQAIKRLLARCSNSEERIQSRQQQQQLSEVRLDPSDAITASNKQPELGLQAAWHANRPQLDLPRQQAVNPVITQELRV